MSLADMRATPMHMLAHFEQALSMCLMWICFKWCLDLYVYMWDSHTYTCSKSSDTSLLIYTFMHICISGRMSICLFLCTCMVSACMCVLRLRMCACLIKWICHLHGHMCMCTHPYYHYVRYFHVYACVRTLFELYMLARFIFYIWIRF